MKLESDKKVIIKKNTSEVIDIKKFSGTNLILAIIKISAKIKAVKIVKENTH